MSHEAFAAFLFAAALFFFMGLNLACDAKRHAQAALNWEKLALGAEAARAERRRGNSRLPWAYRLAGLAFSGFGLWLAAAAVWFPESLLARFKPAPLTPMSRFLGGLLFIAMGLVLSSLKLSELGGSSRLPRGLDEALFGASPAGRNWERRLSFAGGWLVIACFLAFGFFLLSRRP